MKKVIQQIYDERRFEEALEFQMKACEQERYLSPVRITPSDRQAIINRVNREGFLTKTNEYLLQGIALDGQGMVRLIVSDFDGTNILSIGAKDCKIEDIQPLNNN